MTQPTTSPALALPSAPAKRAKDLPQRPLGAALTTLLVGCHLLGCTITSSDFVEPSQEQTNVGRETATPTLQSDKPALTIPGDTPASDCPDGSDCATDAASEILSEAPAPMQVPPPAEPSAADTCSEPSCNSPTTTLQTDPCADGQVTGTESDIDCGGGCTTLCQLGQQCNTSDDCEAQLLCTTQGGVCAPPACDDTVLNGAETDIDCGGSDCPKCDAELNCAQASDCQSEVCGENGLCTIGTCQDGVRNQGESQVDCGLGPCDPCADSLPCAANDECQSGTCQSGTCAQTPTCQDGLINRDESDVDCGGSDLNCPRCQDLATCAVNSDCANGLCDQGVCASCSDGVANGGESAVDCGGDSLCGSCSEGASCSIDSDCQSGACQDGSCCGGSGSDCTRCAARLSSDACTNDQCTAFLQCLRDNSDVCSTRFASGCALQSSDPCFHEDFGGEGGVGVQKANQVLVNASCPL